MTCLILAQKYKSTEIQKYRNTKIHKYTYAKEIQGIFCAHRGASIHKAGATKGTAMASPLHIDTQIYKYTSTKIQKYRNTKIHIYTNTKKIQGNKPGANGAKQRCTCKKKMESYCVDIIYFMPFIS